MHLYTSNASYYRDAIRDILRSRERAYIKSDFSDFVLMDLEEGLLAIPTECSFIIGTRDSPNFHTLSQFIDYLEECNATVSGVR